MSCFKIINGDSLKVLPTLAENSFDACITDPPYGLTSITKRFGKENSAECKFGEDGSFARLSKGFMGKTWDGSGIEYNIDLWKQVYRVLKSGAYLLAFGGTRTFHRIACAIEDAGFEIRDTIMYLYGSGFPKGLNVGLAVDKINGVESKVVGTQIKGSSPLPNNHKDSWCDNQKNGIIQIKEAQNEWAGWGTALKPAYEPIIVARKPLDGTVAQNCLKYGCGAINIDGCRVGDGLGRFPTNVIHDGSEEVAIGMPNDELRYFYCAKASKKDRDEGLDGFEEKTPMEQTNRKEHSFGLEYIDEKGNVHQNPYSGAKTYKRNFHPTVKPTELMQYLIRLVCPKGANILDPFAGSGSTGKAVCFENRERQANYTITMIELTEEYIPIIQARCEYAETKYMYDIDEKEKENGGTNLFDFNFEEEE